MQLNNFARSLARNDPQVYEYILLMVKGDLKMQTTSSDFIFTHLKNIFTLEMNTNTLQYASRVILIEFSSSWLCYWVEISTSTKDLSFICFLFLGRRSLINLNWRWSLCGLYNYIARNYSLFWQLGSPLIFKKNKNLLYSWRRFKNWEFTVKNSNLWI